jgi:hypothetical protein
MVSHVARPTPENGRPPLVVAMTLTIARSTIGTGRLAVEFERFYDIMCDKLVPDYDPDTKVPLLPLTVAADLPVARRKVHHTRPVGRPLHDGPRPATVRSLSVIHPALSECFRALADTLEDV